MTERRTAPVELVVVDMAGTTVRDEGLVTNAFTRALEATGVEPDDPRMPDHLAFVHASMGLSKIEVFRSVLGDEQSAQAATAAFERAVAASIADGAVSPIDGAESTLARLRAAGVQICLTTGFSAETQAQLIDALGWRDRVDLALAPGPGLRGRPHPDLVLQAVITLEVDDVAAVATVGDTTSDLLSGWRAGAGVVAGVLTGAHHRAELETVPHTHILDSIADLPALLLPSP